MKKLTVGNWIVRKNHTSNRQDTTEFVPLCIFFYAEVEQVIEISCDNNAAPVFQAPKISAQTNYLGQYFKPCLLKCGPDLWDNRQREGLGIYLLLLMNIFKILVIFKRLFIKFLSIGLVCPSVTMKPVFSFIELYEEM